MENIINDDKIFFNFVEAGGGPKVEIQGSSGKSYKVSYINSETNETIFEDIVVAGGFTRVSIEYFVPWRFLIECEGQVIKDYTLSLKDKNVLISMESSALGDTLAWVSQIERFRQKYGCHTFVSTFHNELFRDSYPELTFIDRGIPVTGVHLVYRLGWFGSGHASTRNPQDCHSIPLQQVATDILGLSYEEVITKIKKDTRPALIPGKYVAITCCSTAALKYYNRAGGWEEIVSYYKKRNIKVVIIGKMPNHLRDVIDLTGQRPYNDLKNIIQNSEYFIGLASGLAWLAICLGKKSITISGIVKDYVEFQYENYKVKNPEHGKSVCHGCMSIPTHTFQKNDWMWCPTNKGTPKHFECSKTITFEMVKEKIDVVELDLKRNIILNPLNIEV